MKKPRISYAFNMLFNRMPNFEKSRDVHVGIALTWILGSMGIQTTTNDPSFDIEYGYLFSGQMKHNLICKENLIYDPYSEQDIELLKILQDILEEYKADSLKEEVILATSCFSALRQIASDYSAKNEYEILCPRYKNISKQAFKTYDKISSELLKFEENLNTKECV